MTGLGKMVADDNRQGIVVTYLFVPMLSVHLLPSPSHCCCILFARAGQGKAGQIRSGQGRASHGGAGQGRARQGKVGHGMAEQSRAGQGRAGRAWQGQERMTPNKDAAKVKMSRSHKRTCVAQ